MKTRNGPTQRSAYPAPRPWPPVYKAGGVGPVPHSPLTLTLGRLSPLCLRSHLRRLTASSLTRGAASSLSADRRARATAAPLCLLSLRRLPSRRARATTAPLCLLSLCQPLSRRACATATPLRLLSLSTDRRARATATSLRLLSLRRLPSRRARSRQPDPDPA